MGTGWGKSRGQRPGHANNEKPGGDHAGQQGNELSEIRRRRGKVQCHGNHGASVSTGSGRGGCRSIRRLRRAGVGGPGPPVLQL